MKRLLYPSLLCLDIMKSFLLYVTAPPDETSDILFFYSILVCPLLSSARLILFISFIYFLSVSSPKLF